MVEALFHRDSFFSLVEVSRDSYSQGIFNVDTMLECFSPSHKIRNSDFGSQFDKMLNNNNAGFHSEYQVRILS